MMQIVSCTPCTRAVHKVLMWAKVSTWFTNVILYRSTSKPVPAHRCWEPSTCECQHDHTKCSRGTSGCTYRDMHGWCSEEVR